MSTNEYIKNVHDEKWEPFDKRLWQRNYYLPADAAHQALQAGEHIIRTENDLQISHLYQNLVILNLIQNLYR